MYACGNSRASSRRDGDVLSLTNPRPRERGGLSTILPSQHESSCCTGRSAGCGGRERRASRCEPVSTSGPRRQGRTTMAVRREGSPARSTPTFLFQLVIQDSERPPCSSNRLFPCRKPAASWPSTEAARPTSTPRAECALRPIPRSRRASSPSSSPAETASEFACRMERLAHLATVDRRPGATRRRRGDRRDLRLLRLRPGQRRRLALTGLSRPAAATSA